MRLASGTGNPGWSRTQPKLVCCRLQNSRFSPSKSVKKSVKRDLRVFACEAREPHSPVFPVSLLFFSLAPGLLFDCSPLLKCAQKHGLFYSLNNIHEKITQFSLAEKGVQLFCNTSANYKCFLIG